jgi:MFS family permease
MFLPLVPIVWMLNNNVYYLCGAQILSGFTWSGFTLAVSIFLYDAAPAENRIRYIALNNALAFAGISIGSLVGGIIAPVVPAIMKNSLLTVFLISGLVRLVLVIIFIPRITEVKYVPQTTVRELLFGDIGKDLKNLSSFILRMIDKIKKNRIDK